MNVYKETQRVAGKSLYTISVEADNAEVARQVNEGQGKHGYLTAAGRLLFMGDLRLAGCQKSKYSIV